MPLRRRGTAIELVHGSRTGWASDAAPVHLLPPANTVSITSTFSFPDFQKNNVMFWSKTASINAGISFGTILPGEYGPGKSGIYLLSDVTIGTVPAGVNYIDVRVNMNRSASPSPFLYGTIYRILPVAQETFLPGGSALLEGVGDIYKRTISIILVGTNIILRRYQSVRSNDWVLPQSSFKDSGKAATQVWPGGLFDSPLPWNNKWTHGGDHTGWLSNEIEKLPAEGGVLARGSGDAPSTADTSNYASTWTGNITVRPGYIHA